MLIYFVDGASTSRKKGGAPVSTTHSGTPTGSLSGKMNNVEILTFLFKSIFL